MSYLVLARKFRPQTFESIVGQEHISRALANAILRRKVPHAFLFTGPRGVGKTTSARVLARALNCVGRELPGEEAANQADAWKLVEPCGECVNCKEIARSASIAVWEIDGASNNSVDNVRELIESLRSLPPPGSRYKIYIIDEVHMLSVAAFNALLKSLEEPPPNTIFIFATTEPHKIPDTVISRCQRHDFRRIATQTIADCLQEIAKIENIDADPAVFTFIARKAQGGMRDAQSMLDRLIGFGFQRIEVDNVQRVFGSVDRSFFFEQSEAVLRKDPQACFEQLDQAFEESIDIRAFIADFIGHWRSILLAGHTLGTADRRNEAGSGARKSRLQRMLDVTEAELERLEEQVQKVSSFDLQRLFDIAEQTADQAVRSSFPRFVLEAGLAKMASLTSLRPLPQILADLEQVKAGSLAGVGGRAAVSQAAQTPAAPREVAPSSPPRQSASPAVPQITGNIANGNGIAPTSEQGPSPTFNPSWQEFLAHVKSRGALRLEVYLKRVSPRVFSSGSLHIEVGPFELESIKDPETMGVLKECLMSYSGHERWDIQFIEHAAAPANAAGPAEGRPGKPGRKRNNFIPGSIAAQEVAKDRERQAKIIREAKSNPVVRAVLTTFEGSTIAGVEPLATNDRGSE